MAVSRINAEDKLMEHRIRGAPLYMPTDLVPRPTMKQFTRLERPSKIPVNDAVIMSNTVDVQSISSNLNPYSQATRAPLYGDTRTGRFISLEFDRPGANEVKWGGRDYVQAHVLSSSINGGISNDATMAGSSVSHMIDTNYSNVPIQSGIGANYVNGINVVTRSINFNQVNGMSTAIPVSNIQTLVNDNNLRQVDQVPISSIDYQNGIHDVNDMSMQANRQVEYFNLSANQTKDAYSAVIDNSQMADRPTEYTELYSESGINENVTYQAPGEGRTVEQVPVSSDGYFNTINNVADYSQLALREATFESINEPSQYIQRHVIDNSQQAQRNTDFYGLSSHDTFNPISNVADYSQLALRDVAYGEIGSSRVNYLTQTGLSSSLQADRPTDFGNVPVFGAPQIDSSLLAKSQAPVRLQTANFEAISALPTINPSQQISNIYPNLATRLR